MTAASNSEARKRNAPVADPVEVVARAITVHFHEDVTPGHGVNPLTCWQCASATDVAVAALRAEGLLT